MRGMIDVLTGAGISAESGVPVFRGSGGLWRQFRPEDLATPEAFARRPELVWEWYLWRRERIAAAQPNAGHLAIASLAARASRRHVADAERRRPARTRRQSRACRAARQSLARALRDELRIRGARSGGPTATRPRCDARAALDSSRGRVVWRAARRDVIDAAAQAVTAADVVLVVGTSAVVYPVAGLPELAKRRGAKVVEVNVDETPLTANADAVLRGPAGEWLPALERVAVKELAPQDRPREKLVRAGVTALGDNELLALVLGSGVRGATRWWWRNDVLDARRRCARAGAHRSGRIATRHGRRHATGGAAAGGDRAGAACGHQRRRRAAEAVDAAAIGALSAAAVWRISGRALRCGAA